MYGVVYVMITRDADEQFDTCPCTYLRCAEVWIEVVVILPLLHLAGQQHLVMRRVDWNLSVGLVLASPDALLHMPCPDARLSCNCACAAGE